MVAAVEHRDLDVDHGIPREHAFSHGLLDALVDRWDEPARDGTAFDLVDEFVARAGVRLKTQPAIAELPRAAGLLLVTALRLGGLRDRLAIRDAHGKQTHLDARLLLAARDQHVDLRVAHGGEHRLVRFLVAGDMDRRVVFGRAREERAELVLFLLVRCLECHGILRGGQRQRIDRDLARERDGVAGARFGELGNDDDVACLRTLHIG